MLFRSGLFVSDASADLERWVDGERARLRQRAVLACWSLAEAGRRSGDASTAAGWGRRALSLSPNDEGGLRRLIALLDALGDRAGAVDSYDRFARQLAIEYATAPSAETRGAIDAIRHRADVPDGGPAPRRVEPGPPTLAAPAPVERVSVADTGAGVMVVPPSRQQRQQRQRALNWRGATMLLAVVTVLAVVAYLGAAAKGRLWRAGRSDIVLAVLPIQVLPGDTSQQYIADGLAEQLITDLAQVRGLALINRRTMMAYRLSQLDPRAIARELGADAVLAATLQRSGDSLHLSVQLVRAGEQRVTWARSYPAAKGELLRLARQVAGGVATDIAGGTPEDPRAALTLPRPVDPAALDLYVRGRHYWNQRGPGLLRSIQFFRAALDIDPTFALAYSGMADAYVQLGYASLLQPDDAFPKARGAAVRALELDSTLSEPHATLGFVHFYFAWDWPGAEREFRRALTLNPSYATGHEWYGLFLAAMGRFDEAIEHERRAQALDPLSTAVAGTAAWVLYYAGRNEAADRELRIALRADSSFALGRLYLGRVLEARGQLDDALAEYRATGPLRDWVPTVAAVGNVLGVQGHRQEAIATLTHLDSLARAQYVTAYAVALVHAGLGQRDSAFIWLERGEIERTHWMVWLRRDPRWAPIRADPRFEALARRLRLPP